MNDLIPSPVAPGVELGGGYRVQRVLETTTASRRYLADDSRAGGAVAVHELFAPTPRRAEDRREVTAWFERALARLRVLQHPVLAPVLAGWVDPAPEGSVYLVVGYVPGLTLAEELAESDGSIRWRQAVDWALALCNLLSYLHGLQPPYLLGHLRPQHIALDSRTNSPVVVDFGLTAALAGRPWDNGGYMPLEQAISRPGSRSDLYALGALLHALLSGRDPDGALAHALRGGTDLQRALRSLFPALNAQTLGLPPALPGLVARATAFVADDRFPDAASMAAALRALLGPAVTATSSPIAAQDEEVPAWQQLGLSRDAWFRLTPQARNAQLLKLMRRCAAPPAPAPPPVPASVQLLPAPAPAPMAGVVEAAEPNVLLVDQHGDGPYRGIAAALAAAPLGARIEVAPGHYHEPLTIPRAVEIWGLGSGDEVSVETAGRPCLTITGQGVVVRGLALRQTEGRIAALDCAAGSALLEDCTLEGGMPAALVRGEGGALTVRHCRIQEGPGEGVRVAAGATARLEDSAIAGRGMEGVHLLSGGHIEARNSAIRDGEGPGVVCDAGAHGLIEACEIVGNAGAGIVLAACEGLAVRACRIGYNGGAAIIVGDTGASAVEDCDLTGNIGGAWQWPDEDSMGATTGRGRRNRE